MHFNETIQAINAIHILDENFKRLLDQCNEVKKEITQLRDENAKLKKQIEEYDKRERNVEEMASDSTTTNDRSTD